MVLPLKQAPVAREARWELDLDLVEAAAVQGHVVAVLAAVQQQDVPLQALFRGVRGVKPVTVTQPEHKVSLARETVPYKPGRRWLWWCCYRFKIRDSRLLYFLIREIETWLNINHITVHDHTYCIF